MLNIHLVAVGNKMPDWVGRGYADYAARIRGRCALTLTEVAPARGGADSQREKRAALEAERLRRATPKNARVIALDRGGVAQSTTAIARRMEEWMRNRAPVALLAGGADGLPPQTLRAADEIWSLSALTFAHQLVRVVVAEQIYRCHSLLEGMPYHR